MTVEYLTLIKFKQPTVLNKLKQKIDSSIFH